MARPWENLSDYEFEGLVGDLLGADLGVRFERFTRGPDSGIDLRYVPEGRKRPHVVQAKHYRGSTFASLRTAVKKEAQRLTEMKPAPQSYRLVTSLGLTPGNKSELARLLAPFVRREDDVLGRDDVEALLDAHSDVERRHVKLWLASGAHLSALLRAGTHARSRVLAQDISRSLPLYVQGESFFEARELLHKRGVLLIAGPPGIGKTTLARMLVAEAIVEGYEPIEVSADIGEAWDVWDPDAQQIFLYDDFLGRTVLGELTKNEDSRLLSFMREVAVSENTRLVLTTREYILQEAAQTFEGFRRHGLPRSRFLLVLSSYTTLERAKILHNHVWHSDLPLTAKEQLAADRGYRRIVEHRNFNPRTIEYITGLQPGHPVETDDRGWLEFAVDALDHPNEIWRQAFERELSDAERALLLCLATMPDEAQVDDLRAAFDSWLHESGTAARPGAFDESLSVVADTFTATRLRDGGELFVLIANPGLTDFLQSQLVADAALVELALRSARFIEQPQIIWRLLELAPGRVRDTVLASPEFTRAVDRLLDRPGARWVRFSMGYAGARYDRWDSSLDGRLAWLIEIARTPTPPSGALDLAEARLRERVEAWEEGRGDGLSAVRLAALLEADARPHAPDGWRRALTSMTASDPELIDGWEAVAELVDLLPGEFSEDDRQELADRFSVFASEELNYRSDEMESEDDLYRMEEIAVRFGVQLDESELNRARERIDEHLRRQDAMEEERAGWIRESGRAPGSDGAEMDAMFGRLAE